MKKKMAIFTAFILSAACMPAAAASLSGCGDKSTLPAPPAPKDSPTTRLVAPTDGSLPTDHTAAENLAYIAYVLDNQTSYHCYTDTNTVANLGFLEVPQATRSYKDYKDGIMVSSDISTSSFVKTATQACFVQGEEATEVYMRSAETPDDTTTNLTAKWSSEQPELYTEESYMAKYGMFQTEMTNYVVNADTITASEEIVVNEDGTYTLSVTLDPAASTVYYQYGMMTRGGLDELPTFSSISFSVTFDGDWKVLSLKATEVAKVKMLLAADSTSEITATYSYDEADFDNEHFAFYENYFKQYVGAIQAPAEKPEETPEEEEGGENTPAE